MPTQTYHQGTNLFIGVGSATTLVPAANVTSATINLAGVLTNWTVSARPGATVVINNTVDAANSLNISTAGGSVVLDSTALGVHALGAVDVTINGGSFTVGSDLLTGNVLSSGSLTFGAAGGTEVVGGAGSALTLDLLDTFAPISGFTQNSAVIDDVSLPFTGATTYTISGTPSDQTVVVTQGGYSFSFALNGSNRANGTYTSLTGGPLHISADGRGGTDITVCFVRGTRIAVPNGEASIEDVAVGDMVSVCQGGTLRAKAVKWVGSRHISLSSHPRPEMVSPVLIERGAFADNVPHRDLLVSPDHGILADGKLICARQLVNDATIRHVRNLSSVQYFHLELEQHGIVIAEGLPTESYLDTGNRGFFANGGEPFVLHPNLTGEADFPTREAASCAPFVWDEANVKPIWDQLAARAAAMGSPVASDCTTRDPELHVSARGKLIRPILINAGTYQFAIPPGLQEVYLVSRAAAPTDTRPWIEDRRLLGVYVARISVQLAGRNVEMPVDHPGLVDGWWGVEWSESGLRRWTAGKARVPLPDLGGAFMLHVHLAESSLTYPVGSTDLSLSPAVA